MSVQIIGALTQRQLPQRSMPIIGHVIHTTGDTDLDKILRWYEGPNGLQPHYMIALDGVIRRFVFDDHIAWHCKIEPLEARLYQRGYAEWSCWNWPLGKDAPVHVGQEFAGYRMWRETWGSRFQSPLEMVTGDHPNSLTIGIELQQPEKPTADIFTDVQYDRLAALLVDSSARNPRATLDREHVLGHGDVSPMRRTVEAGPWDPGRSFNWNRLWDLVRAKVTQVA